MPYYEYECVQCGAKHTIQARISDERPAAVEVYCSQCECHTVFERVFSTFSGKFGDTPRHHHG